MFSPLFIRLEVDCALPLGPISRTPAVKSWVWSSTVDTLDLSRVAPLVSFLCAHSTSGRVCALPLYVPILLTLKASYRSSPIFERRHLYRTPVECNVFSAASRL